MKYPTKEAKLILKSLAEYEPNFFAIAKWMDDKNCKLIDCFNTPANYGI